MQCVPEYKGVDLYGHKSYVKTVTAECSLPSGEIKKVLAVNCSLMPIGEEIHSDHIQTNARASFYISFENPENGLSKTECGLEFSTRIETDCQVSKIVGVKYSCGEISVKENDNGVKTAYSEVNVEVLVLTCSSVNLLSGGENVLCKKNQEYLTSFVGYGETTDSVQEEFRVGYRVLDVLSRSESAVVTEVQCGVNEVIVDGNVFLRLLLLQNDEKNAIICEERKIPFRTEIRIDGVSPDMNAVAFVEFVRTVVKAVVDEDKNYTDLTADIDVGVRAYATVKKEIAVSTDAYSPINEVSVSKSEYNSACPVGCFSLTEKVYANSGFTPTAGQDILFIAAEKIESVNLNDNGEVSGIISATAVIRAENGYYSTPLNAAFSFNADLGGREKSNLIICGVCLQSFSFRPRAETELEAIVSVQFTEYVKESFSAVEEIFVGNEKQKQSGAVSVYIAKEGDTEWDVCKQLGVSSENIAEYNENVTYPLKGNERIIVYRGL